MRKFLSAFMALILTFALVLSFAGCNKNADESKAEGNGSADAQQEESTGAGKYIDVELDYSSFKENETLMFAYLDNEELHFSTLSEKFGMGEEVARQFYETPEEFYVYTYSITIFNSGNQDIAVYGLRCENNAKDGVYVNTENALGAVFSIGAGSECGATITVICNDPELTDEQTCAIVDTMEFEVICSEVPREFDDGSESVEETKYIKAQIDN